MNTKNLLLTAAIAGFFAATGCAGKTSTTTTTQETKVEKTCECGENKKACCEAVKSGAVCTCKTCEAKGCSDTKTSTTTK